MSRYNVLYLSKRSVWFHAINQGFAQLARTNPGWSYSITTQVQDSAVTPNLYLLDLTGEKEVFTEAFPVANSRMLVLVRASQKRLIRQIQEETRCSILCVDEHYCNFRDIVEASVRGKRFMSGFIRELSVLQSAVADTISVSLTEAESKVLDFIRDGKNGVEISQALFRSQKTISSHKRNIMRKFGVRDDLGLKQKLLAMEEGVR